MKTTLRPTQTQRTSSLPLAALVLALVLLSCFSTFALADSALRTAAEEGNLQAITSLLASGVAVDSPLADGSTPLHWAVLHDQRDAVVLLLEQGADPQVLNRNGVMPLNLAALNGSAAVAAVLLDAGADVNAALPSGETILMTASRSGNPALIELLLAHGARVDARDPEYQQTALMIAARENHLQTVALLARHGAEPNLHTRTGELVVHLPPCKGTGCGSEGVGINRSGVPDRGERYEQKGGLSALLYAAREGNTEVAKLLLDAGADLEATEANGIGPLLMALLNNQLDTAYLLLDYGAKINVADFWGRTPLFAAVDYRNLPLNSTLENDPQTNHVDREPVFNMIRHLLEAGAEVNARTLEWPPEKKWLYSLNDVTWVDMTGMTPFVRAAESGDIQVMQLLLEFGADPHLTTFGGTTALMSAAGVNWTVAQTYTESTASSLAAAQLCLSLGMDVNARNSMGLTPLLGAANRGFNDMILLLAEHGAQLDVSDEVGRTALRWAEGVFLAAVGAESKPDTIALLKQLLDAQGLPHE